MILYLSSECKHLHMRTSDVATKSLRSIKRDYRAMEE